MPKKFTDAVKKGGRVRTVTKGPNKGKLIVYPKGGGHPVIGEKHKGKKK